MNADDEARLTEDQRRKFQEHINRKTNLIGKCPTCGHRDWSLLDHLVTLSIHHPSGNFIIGGATYPNVGLICGNCGNTQLINAMYAGLLTSPKPPKDATDNEAQNGGD